MKEVSIDCICYGTREILDSCICNLKTYIHQLDTFKSVSTFLSSIETLKTASDQKELPRTDIRVTRAGSNNSYSGKASLTTVTRRNIYSRHAMEKSSDENEKLFEKICLLICGEKDEIICSLIGRVARTMFKFYCNSDSDILWTSNLNLDEVLLETAINIDPKNSSVNSGIIVHTDNDFIRETIRASCGDCLNMVLVNSIAYGNKLPGNEQIKFQEILDFKQFIERKQPEADVAKQLLDLNVALVLYRGGMDSEDEKVLSNRGIAVLRVTHYEKLLNLSRMLSVPINFNFQAISNTYVRSARINCISDIELGKGSGDKRVSRYKTSGSYFLIQKFEGDLKVNRSFCSVLLCSRTEDLSNLFVEKFTSCLKKLNLALNQRRFIKGKLHAEERMMELLNNATFSSDLLEKPSWLKNDLQFHELLRQHMISVFFSLFKYLWTKPLWIKSR